jgi:lipoyl(octanoyl) transferase
MPLFALIDFFDDETARSGPAQMALDEALLEITHRPLLRVYRWAEPTVSFGYSLPVAPVRERFPALPCVRRWTGGGIVEHFDDWTFALLVPSSEPLASERPVRAYQLIHSSVAAALSKIGCAARLAAPLDCANGLACFTFPSLHDVVGAGDRKLCGGAQRRTRRGFLHQGSIQNVKPPQNFARHLVALLAGKACAFSLTTATIARANALMANKYATKAWLERAQPPLEHAQIPKISP